MKFVTIVGARPQFIKAAPLSAELRKQHQEILVHTGQHYDENMSDVFFRELNIPAPDLSLGVGSGSHASQTAAMLTGIEKILVENKPDAIIVYGDTNSTVAGALAAAKLQVPIAHVEAGLRSFNRSMPEEINRIVTDHLSRWLFTPSESAVAQLEREGITEGVFNVGDIMCDAVRLFSPRAAEYSTVLERLGLTPGGYAVATVHRAANTDCLVSLREILRGLSMLELPVVLPLHPRTRAAIERHQLSVPGVSCDKSDSNLLVTEPLGYLDMLQLQQHSRIILTDSGGIQKEAYYLGVPCITLRDETEWTETVDAGWNVLVGADADQIDQAVNRVSTPPSAPNLNLYGNGQSAGNIASLLCVPLS